MRFVIQRVQHAEVKVDGEVTGSIGKGFLVLIGVAETDTREIADKMIKKLLGLRIFEDARARQIWICMPWTVNCCWYHNLHCTQIAKKEIVLPSSMPVNRIWRMNYMNTLSTDAVKASPPWKKESLAPI